MSNVKYVPFSLICQFIMCRFYIFLGTGELGRVVDIETRQIMYFDLILGWLLGNRMENRNKGHKNDKERHKNNQLTALSLSYIKYK